LLSPVESQGKDNSRAQRGLLQGRHSASGQFSSAGIGLWYHPPAWKSNISLAKTGTICDLAQIRNPNDVELFALHDRCNRLILSLEH
jgi:hypothetical protein